MSLSQLSFCHRDDDGNVGGELAIGGTDPKHYDQSKLEYVGLTSETYWQFKMSGLVDDNCTTYNLCCCEVILRLFGLCIFCSGVLFVLRLIF